MSSFNAMFDEMPKWRVQVIHGVTEIQADAPVEFGTPEVLVGGDQHGEQSVPLVYAGVYVRSADDDWLGLQTPNEDGTTSTHREMWHVISVRFNDWGVIEVKGMERGDDGFLHSALWELSPQSE